MLLVICEVPHCLIYKVYKRAHCVDLVIIQTVVNSFFQGECFSLSTQYYRHYAP